jgi:polyhydroxyalkanoate synthase
LKIGEKIVGPSSLAVQTLAVVNTADEIAPLSSIKPFADAMPNNVRVIEYAGELGVCLQHLGILVGRHAQANIWPEIVTWLKLLAPSGVNPAAKATVVAPAEQSTIH